ncbi:MAG: translation initiation factor IF-2 [Brevundimonas sp.]|uniref:translation initiation factor IF-2 n=1 Tax=Brevundimonas sp. TaxID=1871086 RepID=UPI00391912D8
MSDENDNNTDGKPQGAPSTTGPRAPLSLRPRQAGSVSTGTVKQSFSHGRSKTVVVETKRRLGAGAGVQRPQGFDVARNRPAPAAPSAPPARAPRAEGPGGLSAEEMEARRRAIELANRERAEREAQARAEQEKAAREAAARKDAEAAAKAAAEAPAPAPRPVEAPGAAEPAPVEAKAAPKAEAAPAPTPAAPAAPAPAAPAAPRPDLSAPPKRAPKVNFGQRAPRKDAPRERPQPPAFGGQSAREAAMSGRPDAPASSAPSSAPAKTVRYSALAPRPAPGANRSDGARGAPAARGAPNQPPATPEVARPSRAAGAGFGRAREDDRDRRDAKPVSRGKGEPKRREGRLTIQALAGGDEDAAERIRSLASVRRAREREKEKRKGGSTDAPNRPREVVIPDIITVQELSNRMAVRGVDIIKFLMRQGLMMKITDVIDSDTAELVADEFGMAVRRVSESDVETGFLSDEADRDATTPRAPVVAIMGHVDHGKTSLLDALRTTDVAGGEAGGITQHIGAYQVRLKDGQRVTFLDTPGHAAFSAMRARGANVTDIVILVVAADDGVMPQTAEAISHAKAAGSPIIVAVNKIDKPDANPQKVINELLQHEIVAESLGGDTQVVEISAKNRTNLDGLIDAVLLQAELMDLKADPEHRSEGVVIEAKLDKGRGPVGTVLVKRGTLRRGDIVVAGSAWGKVRALLNERNEQLAEAGPSTPVEILGLDEAPDPGEPFAVVESEARARELTEFRARKKREKATVPAAVSLADMMSKLQDKKVSELPVLIKADVQGSAEAIVGSLEKMGNEEVRARIVHAGAGGITESDVTLAKSAGAPVIGFNVRASKQARDLAEKEGVEIRYYSIIYDLLDDLKGVLSGMLAPIQRETWLGNAKVLQVFDISKTGKIAGCRVAEGVVRKGAKVRIIRDDVVVLELGTLATLKRFKDEVNEVPSGQECGMHFQGFQDIKEGDLIECFTVQEIKRELE